MCEYCNKNINNKAIKCIDANIDKSKLTILKDKYFGYTILAEIDNLADDSSNVPDIADQFFKINYCPMCGRKLGVNSMARELHHRRKDDKYALYSTVIDDYITPWDTRENIKQYWINETVEEVIQRINRNMEEIDEEI